MELVVFWAAVAIVTAIAAANRGRSAAGWFVLGMLFSVFALVAVLVMAPGTPRQPYNPQPVLLKGDGTFGQQVVGTSHWQDRLAAIQANPPARLYAVLKHEPRNRHDPNAVAVGIDDRMVGYLPREDAAEFVADMARLGITDAGAKVPATLVGGYEGAENIGLRLDLTWPLETR